MTESIVGATEQWGACRESIVLRLRETFWEQLEHSVSLWRGWDPFEAPLSEPRRYFLYSRIASPW